MNVSADFPDTMVSLSISTSASAVQLFQGTNVAKYFIDQIELLFAQFVFIFLM